LTVLDVDAGLVEVGGEVVEVQFDGIGPGSLHLGGDVGPSAGGDPVERRNDGYIDGSAHPLEMRDRGLRANGEGARVGEERSGFGVVVDVAVDEAVDGELLGKDLFLEHRAQHDRAGTGSDVVAEPRDVVRER
jgi:hypothetical protein